MVKSLPRCPWPVDDELMLKYHDTEWGVPVHDDKKHFEFLLLDAFQAGLSWRTILYKRKNFRKAFSNFNYKRIAKYTGEDFERLVNDAGIVRNRAKINAAINNAQRFLEVQKEFGSFDKYIWQFTDHKAVNNRLKKLEDYKATSPESDEMSKDMKARGF